MPKIRLLAVTLLVVLSFVVTACAPSATPTQAPANTAAPVQPTSAPVTQPTSAPVEPTKAPQPSGLKGEVTIWHAYHTGGSEEKALLQIVDNVQKANPDLKINVLAIPFDQVFNKWETEVAAGGGPDMFIAPNDNLGKEARGKLLADLTDKLNGKLGDLAPVAVEGMKVDGKLYAVPESLKAVALYYNKSKITTPPATTDDLMNLVKGGKVLVLNQNAYHNYGFWGAFNGTGAVADDTGKCTADTTGVADALQYLVDLKAAGAQFQTDGGKADTMFRQGQADMIINGPWVLGDYQNDLKDNLGVVPMPKGPKGDSKPLTGVDGWYINPGAKDIDLAVAVALALTDQSAQQIYVDVAGHSPSNKNVTIKDPLTKAFAAAAVAGFARPQSTWFDNYWGPFGDAVTKVVEGQVKAADAVTTACADMNKANKIP